MQVFSIQHRLSVNAPNCSLVLQLYSLGVANPETSTMAIHVVASDVELAQIEAGGGEAASRRVAEALLFTTSITMLKATGQVIILSLKAAHVIA